MTDQLNREIDDLLWRLEERERRSVRRRFERWSDGVASALRGALGAFLGRPPVDQFMITSVVLLAVAVALQFVTRGLAVYAVGLSVLMFVLALLMSVLSPGRRGGTQRRWRGRVIDYSQPSIWTQLRRWIQRRR